MDAINSSNAPKRDDDTSVHAAPPEKPRVWSRSFGTGFVIAAVLAAGCWAVIGWLVF